MKKYFIAILIVSSMLFSAWAEKAYVKMSDGSSRWLEKKEVRYEYEFIDADKSFHIKDSEGNECWKDEKGNFTHKKTADGYEEWWEYDEKGNEIHYKDSNAFECWYEYDDKGNLIYSKEADELECWYQYDADGNEILYKDSKDFKKWNDVDKDGNLVHSKNSDGYEEWFVYDESGKILSYSDSSGLKVLHEYDSRGNKTYIKEVSDEKFREEFYDANENLVHEKQIMNMKGEFKACVEEIEIDCSEKENDYEAFYEYDAEGRVLHLKITAKEIYSTSLGKRKITTGTKELEVWSKYNDKGDKIYEKEERTLYGSLGESEEGVKISASETWTRYDYDKDGRITCMVEYSTD
ncbi:MAG: hypothetical protein K5839_07795 [Treponemataceae bacterium]|nr:hypothetical protein [Treponemataceae bacterium]